MKLQIKHIILIAVVVIGIYILWKSYPAKSTGSCPGTVCSDSVEPLDKGVKSIVYSYYPSCHHCVNFMTQWDKFQAIISNRKDGTIAEKVNCLEHPDKCKNIRGVPDVKAYVNGVAHEYTGDRTASSLINFIDNL